ncbi:SMP-30/gluconolactonase/LRE family protein [Aminobacter sp. MSH1]|uniref:SMP-30/gluconolactonase/LRE family protein n=1 Tax=Aminobacter sp. MSH1 TaxID=374606 RepID=UPI000D37A75E|nr:SMP-30/gluconolactonase/LRE family protein [Aminobacter sp. MSH1]
MDFDCRVVASGLQFPEGPCVLRDGSIAVAEVASGKAVRISQDGRTSVIADCGGGPSGLAVGPDANLYVCNSGGFGFRTENGLMHPVMDAPVDYTGGLIQKIDLETGTCSILYDSCNGEKLRAPNDLVFDRHGGFYFTDLGRMRTRDRDHGGVYYAKADGSAINEVAYKFLTPNGIGLSPDGAFLYVAETETGRLWVFDVEGPGLVTKTKFPSRHGGRLLADLPGYQRFDSLAIDAEGNICVATLTSGRVSVFSPTGNLLHQVRTPDEATTNICFGGPDMRTAYVTYSSQGKLVAYEWDRPGLKLVH